MAEGDIILLQTIKKLFPENEEHFTKLGDFTTDFVLEVTAKLLNVIHSPNKPFKNVKPPSTYLLFKQEVLFSMQKCSQMGRMFLKYMY